MHQDLFRGFVTWFGLTVVAGVSRRDQDHQPGRCSETACARFSNKPSKQLSIQVLGKVEDVVIENVFATRTRAPHVMSDQFTTLEQWSCDELVVKEVYGIVNVIRSDSSGSRARVGVENRAGGQLALTVICFWFGVIEGNAMRE